MKTISQLVNESAKSVITAGTMFYVNYQSVTLRCISDVDVPVEFKGSTATSYSYVLKDDIECWQFWTRSSNKDWVKTSIELDKGKRVRILKDDKFDMSKISHLL